MLSSLLVLRYNKTRRFWEDIIMNRRSIIYVSTIIFAIISLYSVIFDKFSWVIRIPIYVAAALTLFTSCYFVVTIVIGKVNQIKHKYQPRIEANPYVNRIATDKRVRTVVFTIPGVMSNVWFALFNGILGIMGQSAWFGSLSAYYILLSIMRIRAVHEAREIGKIEDKKIKMEREIAVYGKNSLLFILLAIVLLGMVVLLETSVVGKNYPGFLVYGVAAFTFYKIIKSSITIIKEYKWNTPLMMIIRRIGHVDACVSILTLQTALIAAFGQGQELLAKILNGFTGCGVFLIVFCMGIQGIIIAIQKKRNLETGGI